MKTDTTGRPSRTLSLAYVFDEKYEGLRGTLAPEWNAVDKLTYLNHEVFLMIEDSISRELLSGLLSTQLQAQGEKHLLDRNRIYFRILREIITEGQKRKELRSDCTASEIIKAYAMWERALMYDWCLCGGEYSLVAYADRMTPMFLESFREGDRKS